ncbi:hypothetical protein COX24_02835 [bacterium (Candidatus Gribaldobacteria) CG23_combo_of_CG06-09_8_20_14_all_37_87_8]|uniref:Type II secretion system protein GspF domain-containing protein n=1 Tax=bacterium (Candidatus Gribaldobacteria) CG23_combo_of_CG06-09_8_20_14_all_37_87_8 TaxID=2014278 RepID=A0A2G9ZG50_9BACT|nr:MAG: hypothetical protein COX24_02835 [bacterium (Candidatus Gribaldobacteria) CG23_combo_of_CG06-09_8_20_14_all_37_87_8]
MPLYFYKAKNLEGKEIEGQKEAIDRKDLTSFLKKQGYFLLSFEAKTASGKEQTEETKRIALLETIEGIFGVPLTEKLFFTRNLAVMLKTGVSLVRSFEILSLQAKNKQFKKILSEIARKINKGDSLSFVLSKYPKVFPALFTETVKVGEETGKLEESLETLALQMEKSHDLKSKVKSAMVYPCVVLLMAFFIGIFMFIFAVPQLEKAFTEMNITLPLTTKVILASSKILQHYWPFAILAIFGLGLAGFLLTKSGKGGKTKSWLILKMPLISKIVKQANSALMLRTLSSLISAGVPIVKALDVSTGALSNFYYKASLKEAALMVEKGEKLSTALQKYKNIYSAMVLQMIEIGEETGQTADVLLKLANFLESEVSTSTERLSVVIEPILILFIGVVVGFFAVSMMQPMFSMMQQVE